MSTTSSGLEAALLPLSLKLIFFFLKFPSNDLVHLVLEALVLQAYLRQLISRIDSLAIVIVLRVHQLVLSLPIDAIVCIIELLGRYDRLLEVQVALRDVLPHDGPPYPSEGAK